MTTGIPARLEDSAATTADETASIENLSTHGARVVSARPWRTDERLVLSAARYGLHSTLGRVVYCLPTHERHFVIGLEFAEPRASVDAF